MEIFAEDKVARILEVRQGLQRVELVSGERAYVLTEILGESKVGDHVVVNKAAVNLDLDGVDAIVDIGVTNRGIAAGIGLVAGHPPPGISEMLLDQGHQRRRCALAKPVAEHDLWRIGPGGRRHRMAVDQNGIAMA